MTVLDTILDAESRQLSIDELLAEIEAENRAETPQAIISNEVIMATKDAGSGTDPHFCDVEARCHELLGVNGGNKYPYVCGFRLAGTAHLCPRRKRLE